MATEHEIIVYGPCQEGAKTVGGGTYPMSGWGWSCTCHQSGFGYASEEDADDWAERHIDGSKGGNDV